MEKPCKICNNKFIRQNKSLKTFSYLTFKMHSRYAIGCALDWLIIMFFDA